MNNETQKKPAPEMAVSETESMEKSTTAIVAEADEKIKVLLQQPREISRITDLSVLPPTLKRKLSEMLAKRKMYDVKVSSELILWDMNAVGEPVNVVSCGMVYRGTIAVVAVQGYTPVSLTPQQIQRMRGWLLRYSV